MSLPFLLWLAVFIIYLQTIATTVGFIDSGELATVPYILGIAHPTGYPLWTLVTHIFSLLPIAKEEIVRLNIFSALATSSAAAIFFYAMLLLLRSVEKQQEPYQFNHTRFILGIGACIFTDILGSIDIDRSIRVSSVLIERNAACFFSVQCSVLLKSG